MIQIHQRPEIQEINRLPMRSPLIPFPSEKAAVEECAAGPENIAWTKSPFAKSLDGNWRFLLQESADADENSAWRDWTKKTFDDKNWREIKVPGTWTLQDTGDIPHYTNVQMPWTTMPPFVPKKNPTGLYRTIADIPAEWQKRRVVLHIGSAESVAEIFVNGKFCGASKDTRLPCEFDISDFLEWNQGASKAAICVKVIRYSDASFVEDQDQWWFGGIHRSVYLYSTENIYIKDVKTLTSVKEEKAGGAKKASAKTGIIPLRVEVALSQPKNFDKEVLDLSELSQIKIGAAYSVYELLGSPSKGSVGKKVAQGFALSSFDYRETMNEIRADIKIKNRKPHLPYILTGFSHSGEEIFLHKVGIIQLKYIIDPDSSFCGEEKMILSCLDIINNLLEVGEIMKSFGSKINNNLDSFKFYGGKEILEKLMNNKNKNIYEKAFAIYNKYLSKNEINLDE